LWLRLSEDVNRRFDETAFELANAIMITRLAKIYLAFHGEVVEIHFRGEADGRLHDSMRVIVDYLEQITQVD
jgi:hypothetical protein